jgi:hypothetical protein
LRSRNGPCCSRGATATDLVAVEGAEGLLLAVELGLGEALLVRQLLLRLLVVLVVDRLRAAKRRSCCARGSRGDSSWSCGSREEVRVVRAAREEMGAEARRGVTGEGA